MRIIASDSGSAILNERFEPEATAALAAVYVEPPYNRPSLSLARSLLGEMPPKTSFIQELMISRDLLKNAKADEVHLDITLGGAAIEDLTLVALRELPVAGG